MRYNKKNYVRIVNFHCMYSHNKCLQGRKRKRATRYRWKRRIGNKSGYGSEKSGKSGFLCDYVCVLMCYLFVFASSIFVCIYIFNIDYKRAREWEKRGGGMRVYHPDSLEYNIVVLFWALTTSKKPTKIRLDFSRFRWHSVVHNGVVLSVVLQKT